MHLNEDSRILAFPVVVWRHHAHLFFTWNRRNPLRSLLQEYPPDHSLVSSAEAQQKSPPPTTATGLIVTKSFNETIIPLA